MGSGGEGEKGQALIIVSGIWQIVGKYFSFCLCLISCNTQSQNQGWPAKCLASLVQVIIFILFSVHSSASQPLPKIWPYHVALVLKSFLFPDSLSSVPTIPYSSAVESFVVNRFVLFLPVLSLVPASINKLPY